MKLKQDLYYVIEKQLIEVDMSVEETTGWKTITVYDIDTQLMNLIILCEIEAENINNSEKEIQTWLDNEEDSTEYNFIQL